MDEQDFEGTLVLERLASVGLLEDFCDAVDGDDFGRAISLMESADVDASTIAIVANKMADADSEHG
jgi:hypothetical protein